MTTVSTSMEEWLGDYHLHVSNYRLTQELMTIVPSAWPSVAKHQP